MERKAKMMLLVSKVPDYLKYEFIDRGCSGSVYLTEDGTQVYKELHNVLLDKYVMKEFTYLNSDYVAYPRALVYKDEIKDENIIGYLSKYIKGNLFHQIDKDEKVKDIIKAADTLEKEIKKESEKGVLIEDVNAIYTPNKELKLIDTDLYDYKVSEDPYYLYKANMKELGNYLMTILNATYPYNNKDLNEYYNRLIFHGKVKPSFVLNYMLDEMNRVSDYEVETLGEFQESQKLIKKIK